jgi:class 3 adenylate cyclase/tetratricopeptide (TPR) repeat protein
VTTSNTKLTTIVFTDIVRSTRLMQHVGDERAQGIFRGHHALLRRTIAAHGGQELQWLGDGTMASFPSAVRAARCAIALQETVERSQASARLRIRIGIHTGEVLIERSKAGPGFFGTPIVTARRLCDLGEPGTILCSGTVVGLLADMDAFRFRDLGAHTLKGVADPIAVSEVLYAGGAPIERDEPRDDDDSPLPLPALLTQPDPFPFSGRATELEGLTATWTAGAAAARRVVLVDGEPGIGKTRLAAETARLVHARGGTVLFGRCDEGLGVPFQPFVEALEHFLDHSPAGAVRERLGRHAGELVRLVPEIARRVPGLAAPLDSDPATERYRLFDAVAGWLLAATAVRPLLLVLDDLHWADTATLLLLRHVVRAAVTARLVILVTHRDTEVDETHPLTKLLADLCGVAGVTKISLRGLDERGVVELLEQTSGRQLDASGRNLARAVQAQTGGNPFFVGEVLRSLAESGALVQCDGKWASEISADDVRLPAAVRDVVLRRVTRLTGDTAETLGLAAVIGRDFDIGVLSGVSTLDELALIAALDEAASARLVEETAVDRYRFAHALVRSALYERLSASRRARVHHRVAKTLVARGAKDSTALALHFALAGPAHVDAAIRYATRAGNEALASLAHGRAVTHFQQALALLDGGEGEGRAGIGDAAHQRCHLLNRLGLAQRCSGEPGYRETYLAAAVLAERLHDTSALVEAALGNNRGWASALGSVDAERVAALEAALAALDTADSSARARLLATLAVELSYAEDRARRRALSDEALAMARRLDDCDTIAHVLNVRCHTIWSPDTLVERLENSAEHLAVVAGLRDPIARWYAAATRPQVAMEAGDLAEVDRQLENLARLTHEVRQPHLVWAQTVDAAWRAHLAGRLAEAEQLATEAYETGTAGGHVDALMYYACQLLAIRFDQGRLGELVALVEQAVADNPGLPAFRAILALAYCEADRPADARPILDTALAASFAGPFDMSWTTCMGFYAEVAARLGHERAAATLFDLLLPWSEHVIFNGLFVFGAIGRPLGVLAGTLGRHTEADRWFARAVEVHEQLQAPVLLARTYVDWADQILARAHSRNEDRAHALIERALTAATELGLGGVRRRAGELLVA